MVSIRDYDSKITVIANLVYSLTVRVRMRVSVCVDMSVCRCVH